MTLAEMSDFVCNKVNQFDANSQGICRSFINRRYQMIHAGDNWKDTMISTYRTTDPALRTMDFPVDLDRIVTAQVLPPSSFSDRTGTVIEHVDRQFISENHPEWDSPTDDVAGMPQFYNEFVDTTDSNIRKITLYPRPDKPYTIHFHGKALFVPLEDGDAPLIRNIENCLLAFATSDMLERARQYAKAAEKVKEAGVLLEAMRKTENQISNSPRRSKNTTVSGDSLAEITDAVCCRVGDYSEPAKILIREFIRRNYDDLWDSEIFPESFVMARVTRDGSEVILPEYISRVLAVRANSQLNQLLPADQSYYFGVAPAIFEQSGSPVTFSMLTPSAVASLPVGTEQLAFVSTDARDNSQMFVRGEVGGVEVSERVTLDGLTPVFTNWQYDMPMTVAKGITLGDINVTGRVSATFLVQLLADERERKHIRLWLQPFPDDTIDGTECLVLGKRKIHPFVADEDTPLLRGIANVLIALTMKDWFIKAGDDKGATAAANKAKDSLAIMASRESRQQANAPRIVPNAEPDAISSGCGWGGFSWW